MKRVLLFFFLCLFSFLDASGALPPLTIWVRAFGDKQQEIALNHLLSTYARLQSSYDVRFLLCTNDNDPLLSISEKLPSDFPIKFLCADMKLFSTPLNTLIAATEEGMVLSLSVGVKLDAPLLQKAYEGLEAGAFVYGWQLDTLLNDGSIPGKGWYNTAALYAKEAVQWLKTHPFPHWIDNGVLGYLKIENKDIPIGGNEEIWLMAEAIRDFPNAFFVLNCEDILPFTGNTGTGINFAEKLKRKVFVAEYYLQKQLCITPEQLWSHLLIFPN